jgi:hypothetical protein
MPEIVFSTEQTLALDAIAAGASLTQAADQAGVHRNTIANWRRANIGFQLALCNAQYDRTLLFRENAEELLQLALDNIRGILTDPKASPSVRLKASLAIVNIATSQVPPQKKHPWQIEDTLLVPKRNPSVEQTVHNLHNPTPAAPVQTIRREEPKIGRNEACPCGSNLKYKRCCLNKPHGTPASAAATPPPG